MKKIRTGFTLLELLIAVTIFSIVALSLYSSFSAGIRILRRTDEAMRLHQELRLVLEEVSLDLRNSLLSPIYQETPESVVTGEEEEEKIYFFLGDGKKFTFATLKDFSYNGKSRREMCNVTYYFKGGEEGKFIRIAQYQSRGYSVMPDEEEVLLTGIADMEVKYSYEGEDEDSPPIWLDIWEVEEKTPLGVKIKLKLKGLGELRELTKTVFIPVGTLGVEEEGESL